MMFERRLDDLMKFAIIECESVDISGKFKRLKVAPVINDYINQKINYSFKQMSLCLICTHLRDVLIEMKKKYSDQVEKVTSEAGLRKIQDELSDHIKIYEQQIMHLVNFSIKLNLQKSEEKDEEDSLHTDEDIDDFDHQGVQSAENTQNMLDILSPKASKTSNQK